MTALDWLLSFVALAGFILFTGIIALYVPEPDLLVVIGFTLLLAIYDFWIRPLVRRR